MLNEAGCVNFKIYLVFLAQCLTPPPQNTSYTSDGRCRIEMKKKWKKSFTLQLLFDINSQSEINWIIYTFIFRINFFYLKNIKKDSFHFGIVTKIFSFHIFNPFADLLKRSIFFICNTKHIFICRYITLTIFLSVDT